MAPKRPHESIELPENDSMTHLRRQVQQIMSSHSTHETCGLALRDLMLARRRHGKAVQQLQEKKDIAPRLEELPTELLEGVATYLKKDAFGALRLGSRALRGRSEHLFLRRFFGTRTMRLEWESLKELAIVLAVPHLLGALKRAVFMLQAEDPYNSHVDRPNRHLATYRIEAARTESVRTASVSYMLGYALGRITHPVDIELRCLQAGQRMSSLDISLVFANVASSSAKMSSLSIGGGPDGGYFNDRDECISTVLELDSTSLRRSFQTLKCIELSWTPGPRSRYDDSETEPCEMTNPLLRLAPNLHELVIWEISDGLSRSLYLDMIHTRMTKLKTLKVYKMPLRYGPNWCGRKIADFKKRCAPGLARVYLCRVPFLYMRDEEKLKSKVEDLELTMIEEQVWERDAPASVDFD